MVRARSFFQSRKRVYLTGAAAVALVIGVFLYSPHWLVSGDVDFNREIRPIFNQRCALCHGGVRRQAGLSFLFREDALAPAESGKHAIVPGRPEDSELIRRVTHSDPKTRMPAEGPPLTDEEVHRLRAWIKAGARWEPHWAYVPPEPLEPPAVSDPAWPRNGIDHFILERLDREGLKPSPPADRATLIRRAALDLTGLPPAPEDVDRFVHDPSPDAFEKAIDRLLESPGFGEHWAATWLDLARYADSKGYEKDHERTIWKYRDWVIEAFNRDLPFDEFTIAQLAGDLLPEPSQDQLIATAFHRNTMTNDEGGTDDEEFRIAAVIDRINTTFEVWQGTTIGCVQCHSHPYDPVRQREYYEFFAFFNNTADADREDETPVHFSFSEESRQAGERQLRQLEELKEELKDRLQQAETVAERRAWEKRLREVLTDDPKPAKFEDVILPDQVLKVVKQPENGRSLEQRIFLDDFYAGISPGLKSLRKRIEAQEKVLAKLKPVRTPILRELSGERWRSTYILERGNYLVRGEEVEPGVPQAFNRLPSGAPRNRLGVAAWLLSPENPLTARVTVNRFWERLFGTGIVETLEDFGTQGARPSHPELLDWLAWQFQHEQDWSTKRLLKLLVLSASYQQDSRVTPELLSRDPHNRLLARGPRYRLSAEIIRDQALAVGGLLSARMFGPSVFPWQPPGLWNNPYDDREWEDSAGDDRYRRSLYTYWRRTIPYPSLMTFDAPSREVCVSRRIATNTPLQALVLLNDQAYVEAAQALGKRMLEGGSEADQRVAFGYRLAMGRNPDRERLEVLLRLYEASLRIYQQAPEQAEELAGGGAESAALAVTANAILNLDEFVTKE